MTPLQLHVSQWRGCTRCELHEGRKQVVFGRGSVPADVVFIGEAPGESENVVGRPFVGPAGQILDWVIERAVVRRSRSWRWAITNLVGCIPREEDSGKTAKPPHEAIVECASRLEEFVRLCDPRLLVLLGKEARECTEPGIRGFAQFHKPIERLEIIHPAALLRQNYSVTMRELHMNKMVVQIQSALDSLEKDTL